MSHNQVLEIMKKQRERYKELVKQEMERKAQELDAQRRHQEAIEKAERRRKAWADLKAAFSSGNDTIATESAAVVSMDLLAEVWEDGSNCLHNCAAQGLLGCCETIISRKDFQPAMLTVQDRRGWTPLHCAVTSSDNGAEMCTLIARHEACCVGLKDNEKRTAGDLASEWALDSAKTAIMEATAYRYAKVEARTKEKEEAEAVEEARAHAEFLDHLDVQGADAGFKLFKKGQYEDCIKLVKSAWPFINEIDDDKHRCRSLLHYAAYKGQSDVAEAILDREDWDGTDLLDLDRATALHLATANRHVDCVITIIASGRCFSVNSTDMRDRTALHLAAVRGDSDCYNAILAHEGVDLSIRDYRGKLASEYAIDRGLEVLPPVIDEVDKRDLAIDDPDLQVDL